MNDVTGWRLNESRTNMILVWRTGVWLGRHSASDARLIGTPGGVIQVRTVRRLTREQRGDDVSKRAFDFFLVRREILQFQNHLWKSRQLMVRSGL